MRSRHRFVYPTFEETTARAIEACEAAWEFFGGVFAVIIPDNTKAIIIDPDPLGERGQMRRQVGPAAQPVMGEDGGDHPDRR